MQQPESRDTPTAAQTRDSGVQPLGKSVIRRAFARRHESPYMRHLARVAIHNARQMRDWRCRAS
jgi:hypothetical protein